MDLITQLTGIDSDLRTLSEWEKYLPTLQKITEEDIAKALPDVPREEVRTMYRINKKIFEYQQAIIAMLGDAVQDFDRITTDPQSMIEFLNGISEKDMPEAIMKDPEETEEQRRKRMDSVDTTPPKADGKKILDFIQCGDMDGATEVFNHLSLVNKILLFAQYTNNAQNSLIPQTAPFKKITVPLSPVIESLFSNKPLELDKAIKTKKAPAYTLTANYEEAQGAIKDKKTGKVVQFDEFSRQMMDKLATLYEHPSFIWRGYPCTRFEDVYKLLIDDPEARLTASRESEIERFIDRNAKHRVSVDFSEIPGSMNTIKIDTQMLMVNVITAKEPNTEKPVKVICFIQEPLPLTIAKNMGRVSHADDKHPMLMHLPRSAYALPTGINGTPRNISAVGYLVRQIGQRIYSKNKNREYQKVIRIDPLFDAIGETRPERKSKVLEVLEEHMNKLCNDTPEGKPFPELKSWSWVDSKGKTVKQRTRAKKIHGLLIELV